MRVRELVCDEIGKAIQHQVALNNPGDALLRFSRIPSKAVALAVHSLVLYARLDARSFLLGSLSSIAR